MNKKLLIIVIICLIAVIIYGLGIFVWNYFSDLSIDEQIKRIKRHKIGLIFHEGVMEEAIKGLKDGMDELGYKTNNQIIYHQLVIDSFDNDNIKESLNKLIEGNLDVIYTVSAPITAGAREYFTDKEPIVFNIMVNPIIADFAESYSSSETNLTGYSSIADDLTAKRLEIFSEAFPSVKRVMIIYNSANKYVLPAVTEARRAAQKLGLRLIERSVSSKDNLDKNLKEIPLNYIDGIFLVPDLLVINEINPIIKRANELKIPVMAAESELVERGATLSYGNGFYILGKNSAQTLNKILLGYDPREVPIETPSTLELVVNLNNLKNIDLNIAPSINNLINRFVE